ncbi:MAG TPA: hypothetical protein VKX25_05655 [Bryobacteraceae bacterium]|nr:hypothetical protein [Bryobacteraceae bacterium]
MRTAFLFLLPGILAAQVSAPNPGIVRVERSAVANVLGVPGNLLLVHSGFPSVDAIAFSNQVGLIATSGRIRLVQKDGKVLGEAAYAGSVPVLNIDAAAESAVAWLNSENAILRWRAGQFERVPVGEQAGKITSISMGDSQTAHLLAANPDGTVSRIDISLPDGSVRNLAVLPGVHAPAYAIGSYILYADENGLAIESAGGVKRIVAAPAGSFTTERMSDNWVHLYFTRQKTHYALHLAGEPSLSQLPAPAVKVSQ